MSQDLYVIIHNIRSAHNVGAIFRTADGAGVKKIYLTGYTPIPFEKEKEVYPTSAQKMIAKTALGAEKIVPWEYVEEIKRLILDFREKEIGVIALENGVPSVDYKSFSASFPMALILGTEASGIDKDILDLCDATISIPMRGKKESLNVSVAAGIAIYEILK